MRQRIVKNVPIFILPLLLFGIVGPFEIYVGNISEFNFSLLDFYPQIIGTVFLCSLTVLIMSAILPEKYGKLIVSTIFSISVLSYIQLMFMNRALISQDGNGMDWTSLQRYSIGNLVLWIVLFSLLFLMPLYLSKKSDKLMQGISLFLSLLQCVALIALIANYVGVNQEDKHYALSGEEQYKVGREGNIIIFILDQTSNEVFESAMEESEVLRVALKDFTDFDNAECQYSYTFPSMTHILTGTNVNPEIAPNEWKRTAWETEKTTRYYEILRNHGYGCQFFSEGSVFGVLGSVGYLEDSFENVLEVEPKTDRALLYRIMLKDTLYRYAPYILKPRLETSSRIFYDACFYPVENGIEYENISFYGCLKQEGLSYSDNHAKEYKVIHLEGVHGLRTTTAEATYTDEGRYDDDKEPAPKETAMGLGIILSEYFTQLKELEVYDNSMIIVMADHGLMNMPQPIFYVKMPGQSGNVMVKNSAPIIYDDLQATILEYLGEEKEDYGTSIFDWNEGDVRERESWFSEDGFMVFSYQGDRKELKKQIEDDNYRIEGSSTGWKHSW